MSRAAAAEPLIRVRGLRHRYAGATHDALAGIDLEVPAGSSFGLLGPNGAGKSTLLALLTGITPLQQGSIRIDGFDPTRELGAIRSRSALVPQEYAFYPALSGRENLAFFAGIYRLTAAQWRERLDDCVRTCRLQEVLDRRAEGYSGGLKRRLNLAIGLLNDPRILYLDEPTVGIDALSRQCIVDAIRALNQRGTTLIYTSHYMEEVEALCDEIAVIDHGRVVARDRVEELLAHGADKVLHLTLDRPLPAPLQRRLLAQPGALVNGVRLALPLPQAAVASLLAEIAAAGPQVERLQYGVSRLEQVYLALLAQGEGE